MNRMNTKTTPPDAGLRRPVAISGQARSLIEQARRLEAIQIAMLKYLPDELGAGWQLARLDASALVLITDSAARATRLRYSRIALLQSAERGTGVRPASLSIKLAPPRREPTRPEPARLTPAAANSLLQAVEGMEDERLKQALARLARHVQK